MLVLLLLLYLLACLWHTGLAVLTPIEPDFCTVPNDQYVFTGYDAAGGSEIGFGYAQAQQIDPVTGDNTIAISHFYATDSFKTNGVFIFMQYSGEGDRANPIVNKTQYIRQTTYVADEYCGKSLDLTVDYLVVGCPGRYLDIGCVYIYNEVATGTFTEATRLESPAPHIEDFYGSVVAAVDNIVAVTELQYTANSYVHIYNQVSPSNWVLEISLHDVDGHAFGGALALLSDQLFIGASWDDRDFEHGGMAYVYVHTTPGQWDLQAELPSIDLEYNDYYGHAIAAVPGRVIIGGEYYDGPLIYDETTPGVWTYNTKIGNCTNSIGNEDFCASHVALDSDGKIALIHHIYAEHIDVWAESDGGVWSFHRRLTNVNGIPDTDPSHMFFGHTFSVQNRTILALARWMYLTDTVGHRGVGYVMPLECKDQCITNDCVAETSTCVDEYYGYSCACNNTDTHEGEFCEICKCMDGGTCMFNDDSLQWSCNCSVPNAIGTICDKSCHNGRTDPVDFSSCNCTGSGATGKFCTNDIDDCADTPCGDFGVCTDFGSDLFPNHANEYNCSCDAGYYGTTCNDTLCYSSPCLNDGICRNGIDLQCVCPEGFTGHVCETNIDECVSSPCVNGGNCTDGVAGYLCECAGTGFDGLTCENDVDDCASSPCANGGRCKDKGANLFQCNCEDTAYEGFICDVLTLDGDTPCSSSPCQNSGVCLEDTSSFNCDCSGTDFSGSLCNEAIPVDACLSQPCLNGGTCVQEEEDSFTCNCTELWKEGGVCSIPIDLCSSSPCLNGGVCTVADLVVTCSCDPLYEGLSCEASAIIGETSSSEAIQTEKSKNEESFPMLYIIVAVALVLVIVGGVVAYYFNTRKQKIYVSAEGVAMKMPV